MAETTKIDDIDRRILRAIAKDGRIPVQALGEIVGLSPTPVARRLRRLEEQGVVTGYAAQINEAALGYDVSVFVSVKLDRQIDNALSSFEIAITSFPEVVDCWLMTGSRDYLLRVVSRSMSDFEQFLGGLDEDENV